jgi:hypothetical protein
VEREEEKERNRGRRKRRRRKEDTSNAMAILNICKEHHSAQEYVVMPRRKRV